MFKKNMIKIAPMVRKGISCSSQAEAKTKALNAEKAALTVSLSLSNNTTNSRKERRNKKIHGSLMFWWHKSQVPGGNQIFLEEWLQDK